MKRRLYTLDVFTTKPFAGNPLAVVTDGDGISHRENAGHRARDESFRNGLHPAAHEQSRAGAAAHFHDYERIAARRASGDRHVVSAGRTGRGPRLRRQRARPAANRSRNSSRGIHVSRWPAGARHDDAKAGALYTRAIHASGACRSAGAEAERPGSLATASNSSPPEFSI